MIERLLIARERALENAFFKEHDEIMLRQQREADRTRSLKEAIAAASGLRDDAALTQLAALKLGPQGVAALALVPLVLVAWADGALDPKEKAAVQEAAHAAGLDALPEARALLEGWLHAPPGPEMEAAWVAYVHAILPGLTPAARDALHRDTVGRAHRVAEAAGGLLGLVHTVSAAERAVLARLEQAFAG